MRFLTRSLAGLLTIALTLGLLAMAGWTLSSALEARRQAASPIRPGRERVFAAPVATITPETLTPELTAYGSIRARRSLELRAATTGTVLEIAPEFTEGGQVSAGQVLLRLDPADAQDARDSQAATLAESRATLDQAERALTIAQDDLSAAERQQALREQALSRERDKAGRGVGTAALVETAELAVSSAEQAVLSRRSSLSTAQAQLDQARITVERQEIALQQAERTLADTVIRAEFDGHLTGVSAVTGRLVSANEQLGTLIDSTDLEAVFQVSTADFTRLTDAQGALRDLGATVSLEMLGGALSAPARLVRSAASVSDGQTGRQVYATITRPAGLKPGDFVTIRVAEPVLDHVALLPAAALGSDGTLLLVGEGDRLESQQVELMRRQGDSILIAVPPALAGREVVTERSALLDAGLKIRPLRLTAETSAETAADTPAEPETIALTDPRRAALIAAVQANTRMPEDRRAQILTQLNAPEVPRALVERLESRMGN